MVKKHHHWNTGRCCRKNAAGVCRAKVIWENGVACRDLIVLIEEEAHPQLAPWWFECGIRSSYFIYRCCVLVHTGGSANDWRKKPRLKFQGTQSGKIFRLKGKDSRPCRVMKRRPVDLRQCLDTPTCIIGRKKAMLEKLQVHPTFNPKPDKGKRVSLKEVREMFS